jgi:hypothetical protein
MKEPKTDAEILAMKRGELQCDMCEPHGRPIRCFDNGGKTCDRFTVYYMDEPEGQYISLLGMSENPFHPQGFGQHSSGLIGTHITDKARRLISEIRESRTRIEKLEDNFWYAVGGY